MPSSVRLRPLAVLKRSYYRFSSHENLKETKQEPGNLKEGSVIRTKYQYPVFIAVFPHFKIGMPGFNKSIVPVELQSP